MWSRTFTALLVSGLAIGTPALTGPAPARAAVPDQRAPLKQAPADTLGAHDVELLAEATTRGDRHVTLIIVTDEGRTPAIVAQVKSLGGTVARRFDKVGYLLAQVPTGKVLKAAGLAGVAAIDLDERIELPEPSVQNRAGVHAASQASPPAPGPNTPAANPYLPTHEIGSVAFKAAHPQWDGRGITVGVMDSGVDLDHPALRTNTTGQRTIADWVTATDPLLEGDGSWRGMLTEVTGPSFGYLGETWRAPAGTWRMNRFSESITSADDAGGDVNRDGDTTDRFGVLYDQVSHDIRVDGNQNHDFTDDKVMRPYAERFDVGHFGTDDPATAIAERMPFVVEFREDVDLTPAGLAGRTADFVNIGIPQGAHATHVAGIIAGNNLLGAGDGDGSGDGGGSGLDGQAPGARIVSARACSWGGSCTASALATGMVDLVLNRHVDVVNMSIGGLPALNDANNARARLYDKLINDYGVQMFISAGNSGPGLNTVGDPSVANDVVSVAASVSRETWLADYGSVVTRPNALFNFSSRGPREDGGFKPNIVAPGAAISAINTWLPGEAVAEAGYRLPPGYAMFNGTSMAAPQAAGGAALLLSAARAEDRAVTPAGLRRALYSAAKQIDATPAYAQGNGMMDVVGAWSLLAQGVTTRRYTSAAPVCTPISGYLATPDTGTGIYNRCGVGSGGQRAGQPRSYPLRLTRTTGPDTVITHNLTWLGANGAFTSADSVGLPLNRAVVVPVIATPAAGENSGILRVDDPATPTVDFEVLNTVVAAARPAGPAWSFAAEGSVDRSSYTSYFVDVPAGASVLQVNLSGIATGSQVRFIVFSPWGVPVETTSSLSCYTNRPQLECKPQERSYQDPIAGVWQIEVEARRTTPSLDNPFELTARVQGVAVTPEVVALPAVTAGRPTPIAWTVQNRFGPVAVTGRGGPLGSAVTRRPSIAEGVEQVYEVRVPTGAERLDVSIGAAADPAADLDLTVLYNGEVVGQSADGDSEEAVSVAQPEPGSYLVVVYGYAVPAGSTAYDYLDVYFSPALGRVAVPDAPLSLLNGAGARITGTVVAASAPPAGRRLFGEMTVVTDEGAVVGRGAVSIAAVTPGPVVPGPIR